MRERWWIVIIMISSIFGAAGCKSGNKSGPNIRKVKLDMQVDHFEKDFFNLDINNIDNGLAALKTKYGYFYADFMYNVAAFSMEDSTLKKDIRYFIKANKNLYDSIDYYIPHLNSQLKEIENALKRAKIYFPDQVLPTRIITYLGPVDGFGSFASKAGIGVGLQQFLGTKYTAYQSDYLISLFGAQRLHQFTSDYIAPAAITSWISKAFPDKAGRYTLKDKMIEEGRKLYVLKALLPDLPDSTIFGYTDRQMQWCQNNSYLITRYFEHENLLKTKSPEIILEYISDNQRPDSLPKAFPNNIGRYLGFIFVKNYMENHTKTNLPSLMNSELWEIKK